MTCQTPAGNCQGLREVTEGLTAKLLAISRSAGAHGHHITPERGAFRYLQGLI